jgi:hypothetical protein
VPKDVNIALAYLNDYNYESLKEIVDSNVIMFQRALEKGKVSPIDLENVRQLQMCLNDFIEQYNIDIPCIDYEEIENE